MSSAHTEMVLHDPEDREEQNSDNDVYRLLRHSVSSSLSDQLQLIVTLFDRAMQSLNRAG